MSAGDEGLRAAWRVVSALPGPDEVGVARFSEEARNGYLLAIEEAEGAIRALLAEPAPVADEGQAADDGTGYRVSVDVQTGDLTVAPWSPSEGQAAGLSEAERETLDKADADHDYPTETDDGVVQRCACGVWPPTHRDGEQVDPGMWLWLHRRAERHAAVERILAARGATRGGGAS